MDKVTVIGIDLAKNVFQLAFVDAAGEVVAERRVRRAGLEVAVAACPGAVVAMEACGGAHHWARTFQAAGHPVRLMAPKRVKAYQDPGRKDDRRDARAIAEAASRPHVPGLRIKSTDEQDAQSRQRIHRQRVRMRTTKINVLRGLLMEYGIALPQGDAGLKRYAELAGTPAWEAISADMRAEFDGLYAEIERDGQAIAESKARLVRAAQDDGRVQRLRTIPGIGPMIAAATVGAIGDGSDYADGRKFATSLGLTPRLNSSGERVRLGRISLIGDGQLRALYVNGAQALLMQAKRDRPTADALILWARRLLKRKRWNEVVVALANKLARVAWAVLRSGDTYRPRAA
jgi:transposase